MTFFEAFGAVAAGLVVLFHPFGTWPIFLALTSDRPITERRRVATKTCIAATVISVLALLAGSAVLSALGLTIPALQVTGGVVLSSMGFPLLMGTGGHATSDVPDHQSTVSDPSVVPLALPVTSGSAVIVSLITFATNYLDEGFTAGHAGAIVGILAAVAVVWLTWQAAPWMAEKLSAGTIDVVDRLTGLVILGLGVSMLTAGLGDIFPAWTIE